MICSNFLIILMRNLWIREGMQFASSFLNCWWQKRNQDLGVLSDNPEELFLSPPVHSPCLCPQVVYIWGQSRSRYSLSEQDVDSMDSPKSGSHYYPGRPCMPWEQDPEEASRSQKEIRATASFNFSKNIYDVSLEAFKPAQNTAFTDDTHFSKSLRGDSLADN